MHLVEDLPACFDLDVDGWEGARHRGGGQDDVPDQLERTRSTAGSNGPDVPNNGATGFEIYRTDEQAAAFHVLPSNSI